MLLDQLPMEVHAIICDFACSADMNSGARTYRTVYIICLVSRYFYSIAVPIMYKTLIIDGRTKACLLSRTLQSRPELGGCAVHLFLTDHGRQSRQGSPADDSLEVLPPFAFEYPGSREGRIKRLQRMQLWLTARAQRLAAFRSAVQHILDIVSPNLHILSICLYGHYDGNADNGLADSLAHPFPALVELTIRDNMHPFPYARLEFPMLERLHLAGGNLPHPFTTLGSVVEGCPRLTHIHLTEPFVNDAAVSALERLTGATSYSYEGSESKSKLEEGPGRQFIPGKLRRLILKPSPYTPASPALSTSYGASARAMSKDVYERLETLAAGSDVLEVVWPPSQLGGGSKREDRYPLDHALRDWTDCIMGREGFRNSLATEVSS